MSALPLKKRCPSCGRLFTFTPSVGDLGSVCPCCHGSTSVGLALGREIGKAIGRLLYIGKGK